MNDKNLTLEDKIKPFLILSKAFQTQIDVMRKVDKDLDNERIERLEKLINSILNQMLLEVEYEDLIVKDYNQSFIKNGDIHRDLIKSFVFSKFREYGGDKPLFGLLETKLFISYEGIFQLIRDGVDKYFNLINENNKVETKSVGSLMKELQLDNLDCIKERLNEAEQKFK